MSPRPDPSEFTQVPSLEALWAFVMAEYQARLQLLGEVKGTKYANRYIELTEDRLIDISALEKVVLIRGDAERQMAIRNRKQALAWFRRLHPVWLRAAKKRRG